MFSASGAASDSDTISVSDDAPLDSGSHHAATATTTTAPADLSTWGQLQREDIKEDLKESDLEKEINITLTVNVLALFQFYDTNVCLQELRFYSRQLKIVTVVFNTVQLISYGEYIFHISCKLCIDIICFLLLR